MDDFLQEVNDLGISLESAGLELMSLSYQDNAEGCVILEKVLLAQDEINYFLAKYREE